MDLQTILLSLIYTMVCSSLVAQLWTIFVDHTWCCGGSGWPPANLLSLVDPTQDSENIWGRTPAASKISALACPGWAVATLILWIGMPWEYYPGCEMIICRAIAISCIIHQLWWWLACFGKVDVNDVYQRDASVYLVHASIPDFILGASAAYVGFLSGQWGGTNGFLNRSVFYFGEPINILRVVILFFLIVCACFACVYSAFYSQELIVKDAPNGPNDPPPATLWNMTPAGSKICAIRASAWTMSFFATGLCVICTLDPFLIKMFYQCLSVAYVWFQFLYYFGMLSHTDDDLFRGHLGSYASSHVRRWNDFFKWRTFPGHVIFFIMFTMLGSNFFDF